jgi:hypothetical protein
MSRFEQVPRDRGLIFHPPCRIGSGLSHHEMPRRVRHVQHGPVRTERPDIASCLAVQRQLAQDFAEQRSKLEAWPAPRAMNAFE